MAFARGRRSLAIVQDMRIRFRPRMGPFVLDTTPRRRTAPVPHAEELILLCIVLGIMVVIGAMLLVSLL